MTDTIFDYKRKIIRELSPIYSVNEAANIANMLLSCYLKMNSVNLIVNYNKSVTKEIQFAINNALKDLKKHKPIQYILKEIRFCNLKFKVNQSVFIPRQETEELVELIINESKNKKITILDIGTGSGCIAIVLKSHLTHSQIIAIDSCEKALSVAKENAEKHKFNITFKQLDILNPAHWKELPSFDVIISNPPYVLASDYNSISPAVANYEPHKALFVNDEDPLVFYHAISEFSINKLNSNGKLYFEINEKKALKISQLLKSKGFIHITILKDINNQNRIIHCQKR